MIKNEINETPIFPSGEQKAVRKANRGLVRMQLKLASAANSTS